MEIKFFALLLIVGLLINCSCTDEVKITPAKSATVSVSFLFNNNIVVKEERIVEINLKIQKMSLDYTPKETLHDSTFTLMANVLPEDLEIKKDLMLDDVSKEILSAGYTYTVRGGELGTHVSGQTKNWEGGDTNLNFNIVVH